MTTVIEPRVIEGLFDHQLVNLLDCVKLARLASHVETHQIACKVRKDINELFRIFDDLTQKWRRCSNLRAIGIGKVLLDFAKDFGMLGVMGIEEKNYMHLGNIAFVGEDGQIYVEHTETIAREIIRHKELIEKHNESGETIKNIIVLLDAPDSWETLYSKLETCGFSFRTGKEANARRASIYRMAELARLIPHYWITRDSSRNYTLTPPPAPEPVCQHFLQLSVGDLVDDASIIPLDYTAIYTIPEVLEFTRLFEERGLLRRVQQIIEESGPGGVNWFGKELSPYWMVAKSVDLAATKHFESAHFNPEIDIEALRRCLRMRRHREASQNKRNSVLSELIEKELKRPREEEEAKFSELKLALEAAHKIVYHLSAQEVKMYPLVRRIPAWDDVSRREEYINALVRFL